MPLEVNSSVHNGEGFDRIVALVASLASSGSFLDVDFFLLLYFHCIPNYIYLGLDSLFHLYFCVWIKLSFIRSKLDKNLTL